MSFRPSGPPAALAKGMAACALLTAGLTAGSAGDLRAQYRNDPAALYAAIAAHVHEASADEPLLLIGDPRIWGILPRRVVQSIVARLAAGGIPALDCRSGCFEQPGDLHLAFGPIAFLPDASAWVTVYSFAVDDERRMSGDRTAYHVEYRDERWRVLDARPAWTI
ncbi:MAG TPA: hypothetical protein VM737_05735 [Gemmatimonadota bacterium]|nr:hypothetical protein [Gemmatimonadota bacterium]